MARVVIDPKVTQDEYYNKNISRFEGLDGNKPFKPDIKHKLYSYWFPSNERFFLHPFKFGKYSFENGYVFDSLRFVNYSSNEMLLVPIDYLVRNGIKKSRHCSTDQMEDRIFTSQIHTHLNSVYKNAVPYISIKEILNEAVKIIGNKHIYFEYHAGHYLNDSSKTYDECQRCRQTFEDSFNNVYNKCRKDICECMFAHIK
ncbi:MAG: hypothetical protein K2L45_09425 [Muribaculaceae bacterium]|nr:hypothetical protein [Muribaculaceae bacterium]